MIRAWRRRRPPRVTVVTATWNRGAAIVPTLRSVLWQTMPEWEHLVIGDASTDDTADHVAALGDDRTRWINLDERWGAQSGPNNRGIAEARGEIIAFLGHDDIWAPDHLAALVECFDRRNCDAAVSGMILHAADPSRASRCAGLFGPRAPDPAGTWFFPPTCLSLRPEAARRAGPWARREEIEAPVDVEFQSRLRASGARFASTGRVTAHKFSAADRYLSYLVRDSDEQAEMLRLIGTLVAEGAHDAWRGAQLAHVPTPPIRLANVWNADAWRRRSIHAANDTHRGLRLPELRPLGTGQHVAQDAGARSQDWLPAGPDWAGRWRVTGPNAQSRMAVPVTGAGEVRVRVELRLRDGADPGKLRLRLNDGPWAGPEAAGADDAADGADGAADGATHRAVVTGRLRPDRHSVLEIAQSPEDMAHEGPHRAGVAVGALRVEPAE